MLFLSPLFEAGASLSYQHKWVGTFKHFSSHFSSFCLLTSLVYRDPPLCIGSTLDYPTTMLERCHTGNRNISEALWCIFKSFIMTGNMFFQWGKVHIIVRRGIHDHMKTWIASRCLAWPLNHRSTLHKRTPSFLELSRSVIPFKNSVDHFNLGLFYFGKSLLSKNKISNF